MIEELWTRAACADVLHFLNEINEATAELLELGHISSDKEFDCNDFRTRVYATSDGDVRKVFVKKGFGVCVSVHNDRIVVSTGAYAAGTEERVLLDFSAKDVVVTGINHIAPYDDKVASILRGTLLDLSSVHCQIVREPEPVKTSGHAPS